MNLHTNHEEDFRNYLDSLKLKPVTRDKHLLYFKHLSEMFNGFINQKTIDSFLTQKTSSNHRAMVQHLIELLKRDSSLSHEEQLEISRLSILKQVGRKVTNPIRILSKEEINKIINNSKLSTDFQTDRFKLMVKFQYSSGLRINELCSLRFEHLNYQGRNKFFEDNRDKLKYQKLFASADITKGNKGAFIYIKTDVYLSYFDFLKKWKEISPTIVNSILNNKRSIWGINKKKYSKFFKEQVFKTLGFRLPDNKSTHILRHSICTHLLADGMPLLECRDFMRHSSVSTTERYLHLIKDSVSNELEKLNYSSQEI
jgi:integrase/recombinase XerC